MDKIIKIYEDEFATLVVYPEMRMVHHTMHKFIYGNAFRNLLMEGLEAFKKYNCNKWLSDDRNNSALRKEDLTWSENSWEPLVFDAGWEYWALVLPEMIIGQMNMRRVIERYKDTPVTVKLFSNPDDAMKWLEKL